MPADAPELRREGPVDDLVVQRDERAPEERRVHLAREENFGSRTLGEDARQRFGLSGGDRHRGADHGARDSLGRFRQLLELARDRNQVIQPPAPQQDLKEPIDLAPDFGLQARIEKRELLRLGDTGRLEVPPRPRIPREVGRERLQLLVRAIERLLTLREVEKRARIAARQGDRDQRACSTSARNPSTSFLCFAAVSSSWITFSAISTASSTTSFRSVTRALSCSIPISSRARVIISWASFRAISRISEATRWPSATALWIRSRLSASICLRWLSYCRRRSATDAFSCSIRSYSVRMRSRRSFIGG